MAHPDIDTFLNPTNAQKDSAQARMKHFQCIIFTGAQAPQRIAKFVREYVNEATYTGGAGGNKMDPSQYTIDDQGLPAVLLHTIYFSDGIWYVFFDHHAPYDATVGSEWPFNKLPNNSDTGYNL